MSAEEECECPKCPEGLPDWLATFADLMSLLMCFFVLLLSFSVIDAQKYKQIAGSLKMAFGVQRIVEAEQPPMGVSLIALEFSPATPEDTIMNEVKQITQEELEEQLKTEQNESENTETDSQEEEPPITEEEIIRMEEIMQQKVEQKAEEIREILEDEIESESITVEAGKMQIIIRINEKGSFPSGSATLNPAFVEVMDRISDVLVEGNGGIVVAGHTDNIPIKTARFRSNWELSVARAVTVTHELLRDERIDAGRVAVEGHADTMPLAPNDSWENRAKNRRVEIVLRMGEKDPGPSAEIQEINQP